MLGGFRASMTWLHTWCGLVFGWLLFAIFFTGSVAVFRHEIDYWMMPELHVGPIVDPVAAAEKALLEVAPGAARWVIEMPGGRAPILRIRWQQSAKDRLQTRYLGAHGEVLAPRATSGGSMLYRFHYGLLLGRTGMWIVGGLAMAMLVGLVTGVVIHAKIFQEFFTFRPLRAAPRAWQDAHTVTGVLMLPFCLMITYSGLVIWWFIWMPGGLQLSFPGDQTAFFRAMNGPASQPIRHSAAVGTALPLSRIVDLARETAPQGLDITTVTVLDPGRDKAKVEIARTTVEALWGHADRLHLSGIDGSLLFRQTESAPPAAATYRITRILHEIKFAGPGLRWMAFLMGLGSCVVIATGTVLWGVKRRLRHARELVVRPQGPLSTLRAYGVDCFNVAVIAGIGFASTSYVLANRLLPARATGRAEWEVVAFFLSWFACGLWALGKPLVQWRRYGSEHAARRAIRLLWSRLWTASAAMAFILLIVDQTGTGGTLAALARGDGIVLAIEATIVVVVFAMAFAAYRSSRPAWSEARRT